MATRGCYCFCRKIFRCVCDSSPAVDTGRRSACGFLVRPIFFFSPFSYNVYNLFSRSQIGFGPVLIFSIVVFARPDTRIHRSAQCTRNYYYYHYFASFPTENHRTGTIHFTRRVHNIPSSSSAAMTMTMIITVVVYRAVERCPWTDDFRMMYRYI